jgi:hypothetical protein
MGKEFSILWSLLKLEDFIGKHVGIVDGASTAKDIKNCGYYWHHIILLMWSALHADTVIEDSVCSSTVQDCNISIASKSFKRFQIANASEK